MQKSNPLRLLLGLAAGVMICALSGAVSGHDSDPAQASRKLRNARAMLKHNGLSRLAGVTSYEDSVRLLMGPRYIELVRADSSTYSSIRAAVVSASRPDFDEVARRYYALECPSGEKSAIREERWESRGSIVSARVLDVLHDRGLGLCPGDTISLPCYSQTTARSWMEPSARIQVLYPGAEFFAVIAPDWLCPATQVVAHVFVLGEPGTTDYIPVQAELGHIYRASAQELRILD